MTRSTVVRRSTVEHHNATQAFTREAIAAQDALAALLSAVGWIRGRWRAGRSRTQRLHGCAILRASIRSVDLRNTSSLLSPGGLRKVPHVS